MSKTHEVKQRIIRNLTDEWMIYNAYFEAVPPSNDEAVHRNMERVERSLSILWNMSIGDTQTELYNAYAKATVGC